MIFIEPEISWRERHDARQKQADQLLTDTVKNADPTGWAEPILAFLTRYREEAIPILTVANEVSKWGNYKKRLQVEDAKRIILRTITTLIKVGKVVRVSRKFVRLAVVNSSTVSPASTNASTFTKSLQHQRNVL